MATTISTQDIVDAKRDIDDIGKAVNEKVIVSPRYGEDFKSLPMIAAEFQISSDAAEVAAISAAESANIAQSSSQIAQSSANIAEAAATAATIGAGVFETPEAGADPVTGVADGAYFNVRSSSDESYVDEYQNIGGVATPSGKSYPSSNAKWDASQVVDASGKNQQEINDSIAVKFITAKEAGLTKWDTFKKPPYTSVEYEQAYNNGINLTAAIKQAYDDGYREVYLEGRGSKYPVLYTNESGLAFNNNRFGAIKLRDISDMTIDLGFSTIFVIFDSEVRSPYDKSTTRAPYMLHGAVFDTKDAKNITVRRGIIRGDQYMRKWVAGENAIEQTYGVFQLDNSVGCNFSQCTIHGFRGDSISGQMKGYYIKELRTWSEGAFDETNGAAVTLMGAYNTGLISLDRNNIIDDAVSIVTTTLKAPQFRNQQLNAFFFRDDNSYIGYEQYLTPHNLTIPKDCVKIAFVAYDDERTDTTVEYGRVINLSTGMGYKTTISDCVFFQNMRGGVSNLGGQTVIERCAIFDIGMALKQGFPSYSDPTRYGINFENFYSSDLTVRDCWIKNAEQGILAGTRSFRVTGCTLENIKATGIGAYSVANGIATNNTLTNVGTVFKYQHSSLYLPKVLTFSNNICNTSELYIDISTVDNLIVSIENNVFYKHGRFSLIGNGRNIVANNNKFYDWLGYGNQRRFEVLNVLEFDGNTCVFNPDNQSIAYQYLSVQSTIEGKNTFIDNRGAITRTQDVVQSAAVNVNSLAMKSSIAKYYQLRLTNISQAWSDHEDVFNFKNCEFDNVVAQIFASSSSSKFYDGRITFKQTDFLNGGYIYLNKVESSALGGSKTSIIVNDCHFDLTSSTRVFYNQSALYAANDITFINCTFISDVAKSIAFVQGNTNNITASAKDCKFINVTNTDSILQIDGQVKTTYDPPSIASEETHTTTVTLSGASVGAMVQAAFSQYNADIEISAAVSVTNTVTVKFKNIGTTSVDLAEGTLTVKLL